MKPEKVKLRLTEIETNRERREKEQKRTEQNIEDLESKI